MSGDLYIWIVRWEDFQHYAPERDRAPAWIKNYTKQHDDEDYLDLTAVQRATLHDLRIAFAKAHGKLGKNTRNLSGRFRIRVTEPTLAALNHAGFIDFCSRETLDKRLEEFYSKSSPRARPRARIEVEEERDGELEEEIDIDPRAVSEPSNGTNPQANSPGLPLEQITPQLRSIA